MKRNTTVTFSTATSKALNVQKQFDQYGFPFTLNPTVGCPLVCKFCYSPIFVSKVLTGKRRQFFENIRVKMDIPALLDKELTKYAILPQHLKRVQINETSDYYAPRVINSLAKEKKDIMLEILEVFQKHDAIGNHWMLHILTKSNLILNHLPILTMMKHMAQIEISFTTHNEKIRQQLEFYTIPTNERLKVVKALADAGLFVRIMAMPFYGTAADLKIMKDMTFGVGTKAFKNKGLNYYHWNELFGLSYDDLINDKLSRNGSRVDVKDLNFMIKSGENHLIRKKNYSINLLMPLPKQKGIKLPDWSIISKLSQRLAPTNVNVINCGYSEISKIDWRYIK